MSSNPHSIENLIRSNLRDVPDFPRAGIVFKDITPLLKNPLALNRSIDAFANMVYDKGLEPTAIIGIEARGFIFGALLAQKMNLPFIPVRKAGKLPWKTHKKTYNLEYGTATIEMHEDSIDNHSQVIIVDDLLATGGTAEAAALLVQEMGGKVLAFCFMIELAFLSGRQLLEEHAPVHALCPIS